LFFNTLLGRWIVEVDCAFGRRFPNQAPAERGFLTSSGIDPAVADESAPLDQQRERIGREEVRPTAAALGVNVQVRLRRIARVSHPAYLLPLPDTIPRSHRNT
jgi:hypothetical protein